MAVGVGYTSRELCDGMALPSPGRWPPAKRRYPERAVWREVADKFLWFARTSGTPELLMKLALGRVESCPFDPASVRLLKEEDV